MNRKRTMEFIPGPRFLFFLGIMLWGGSLRTNGSLRAENPVPTFPDPPKMNDTTRFLGNSQGELLPAYYLDPVEIHGRPMTTEERNRYLRLIYNVRRTYPYAVLAKERMDEYNHMRRTTEKKKDRRKYLKEQEEKIRDDFMEDLKSMTRSQGAILIKLLARQTDTTAYFLLKDFRGGARALAYQTMARFWGYNLKDTYDPQGSDREIENIVRLIEEGKLSPISPKTVPALERKKKKKN